MTFRLQQYECSASEQGPLQEQSRRWFVVAGECPNYILVPGILLGLHTALSTSLHSCPIQLAPEIVVRRDRRRVCAMRFPDD